MRQKPGQACKTLQANTWATGAPHKLIMSTSGANITFVGSSGFGGGPPPAALNITHAVGGSITFNVQDLNGNPVDSKD